jgi:hypothetical protein
MYTAQHIQTIILTLLISPLLTAHVYYISKAQLLSPNPDYHPKFLIPNCKSSDTL